MNGYENYQTWAAALWLTNEEVTYKHWTERAKHCMEAAKYSTFEARYLLADEIKNAMQEAKPELKGLMHDLLESAIEAVNYEEVAEVFLNE